MRKVVANWKMNLTLDEAALLAGSVAELKAENIDIVVCPAFTLLASVKDKLKNSKIKLGAQNVAAFEKGAFTGEVSAQMLIDAGCEYVIIGHSERRIHCKESNETIAKKIELAINAGLKIIVCVGESKSDSRDLNVTEQFVTKQLTESLGANHLDNIIIAYEPLWSINSNIIPDNSTIYHVTALIKKITNNKCLVLYGGSVNSENIETLAEVGNIDGVLVGNASLKYESFKEICVQL